MGRRVSKRGNFFLLRVKQQKTLITGLGIEEKKTQQLNIYTPFFSLPFPPLFLVSISHVFTAGYTISPISFGQGGCTSYFNLSLLGCTGSLVG